MCIRDSSYVVGETISPAIYDDDCIIAISGSGETNTIVSAARIAKNRGSKVLAVTSYPESTLGQLADGHLLVKGRTKKEVDDQNYMKRQIYGNYTSLTPLGTAFELTTLVFLDAIVSELMEKMHQTESDLKSISSKLPLNSRIICSFVPTLPERGLRSERFQLQG